MSSDGRKHRCVHRTKKCRNCKLFFSPGNLVFYKNKIVCSPCRNILEDRDNTAFYNEVKAVFEKAAKEIIPSWDGYRIEYNDERKDVVNLVVPEWHKKFYWGFIGGLMIHTILKHVKNARVWHINKERGKPLYIGFTRGDRQYDQIIDGMVK